MTYLALARKWRPRTFEDVVGQPHIVRALSNALASGRVHHAFLFAGTRGVGKTTVARILARCLNCEQGVTATPCGSCPSCIAIEEGRFVDLIEVDAASRTGIDDIRELLDNVQYTPGAGRYKVYLVDEVHMLSKAAFNALLKTLEEPPPHVKFLFATTDPQKLPVTVLSRCLQFNLKRLSGTQIADRMARICEAEGVTIERGALLRLARAASGSMRDGLSLLDQALAFGNERLAEGDVAEMLGSLDRSRVLSLLEVLAGGDGPALLARLREVDALVPDYAGLLDDIAAMLQQLAVLQLTGVIPEDDDTRDGQALQALAGAMDPESVQLYYQIAILGRRDLGLAPEPRIGFEMTLLRMLAFRPDGRAAAVPEPASTGRAVPAGASRQAVPATAKAPATAGVSPGEPGDWPTFVQSLRVDGAARQLAMHTQLMARTPSGLQLSVDRSNAHLLTDQLRSRLSAAINERLGNTVTIKYEILDTVPDTAAVRSGVAQDAALERARQAIEADPNVRALSDLFGAELVTASIRPAGQGTGDQQ
ncbi:MAG: DNA polymerase III subunit gamma/tau [Gammaproteobacteria bacterium PRO9]|nr:DNA polymerase III subunit gamma/tau [Gammaproteobacteria bacterium]MCE7901074.1 DNA polymerase III subunit gamma/tau [Gammaproteobacteria bacterium PRO9]MCQ3933372.1 DNA polymerase III subunit gamma/tau [Gammaproteobacteria bacterium]